MLKVVKILIILIIFASVGHAFLSGPQEDRRNSINIAFGDLHTHSNYGDGVLSPKELYEQAKLKGFNFLSINEHHFYFQYDSTQAKEKTKLPPYAKFSRTDLTGAARLESYFNSYKSSLTLMDESFVPLIGLEVYPDKDFGSFSFINMTELIPKELMNDPRTVLEKIKVLNAKSNIVGIFNHPMIPSWREKIFGRNTIFESDKKFVTFWKDLISLMEIKCGPMDHEKYFWKPEKVNQFESLNKVYIDVWLEFLSMGFKLAPIYDQCGHSAVIGNRSSGRTAVYYEGEYTQEKLLKALKNRHTYATEDLNLSIKALVNEHFLPGDELTLKGGEELNWKIEISDTDEPEAIYEIAVWKNPVSFDYPNKREGIKSLVREKNQFSFSISFDGPQKSSYYILVIEQQSVDPINHSKKNRTIFAPIWVNRAL